MTHSEEEFAFVAKMVENPNCDTTKLIFCDWLQENDQELRADFVRASVATGSYQSVSLDDFQRLHNAAGYLLTHSPGYALGDRRLPWDNWKPIIRKGFVTEMQMTLRDFEDYAPLVCRIQPVQLLRVSFHPTEVTEERSWGNEWPHIEFSRRYRIGRRVIMDLPLGNLVMYRERDREDRILFEIAERLNRGAASLARGMQFHESDFFPISPRNSRDRTTGLVAEGGCRGPD